MLERKLRFVDTFAGIGGFHIGAARAARAAGLEPECVASVEIDTATADIYEKNHGRRPWIDITKIPAKEYPDHEVLLGGFPCQSFSRNGRYYNHKERDLANDDRSNLFIYLVEILREKHPPFFVFENVKEIKTIRNGDGSLAFDTIMANFRGAGYVVSDSLMNSADFGVPQQRMRSYFVGVREDVEFLYMMPEKKPFKRCVRDILEERVDDKYLLSKIWANREMDLDFVIAKLKDMRSPKEAAGPLYKAMCECREANGDVVPRLVALEWAAKSGNWPALTRKTNRISPIAILYGATPSGGPRQQDKLYNSLGISPTIATLQLSIPNFDAPGGWRQLTPRECARLQGFPDDFVLHEDDTVAYKHIGNAVTTNVVEAVLRPIAERIAHG